MVRQCGADALDLRGADLLDRDLRGGDFVGADFHCADLRLAQLAGADLRDAMLTGPLRVEASTWCGARVSKTRLIVCNSRLTMKWFSL